jgi:hypothetical protein
MPLNPPTDGHGNVIAHDDPNVSPHSMLIRHINEAQHVILDENINGRRIASAAFSRTTSDPDNGMSVDLGQLLAEAGLKEDAKVPPGMGAVKLPVGPVRDLNCRVGSEPTPTNAFHGQIWDVKDAKRKKLHKLVIGWVVPLSGVAIR